MRRSGERYGSNLASNHHCGDIDRFRHAGPGQTVLDPGNHASVVSRVMLLLVLWRGPVSETLMSGALWPIFGGYVLYGYSGWYDDVDLSTYIRPGARFSQEKISSRCLSGPSFIANLASLVIREPYTQADPSSGPLHDRFQENIPNQLTGLPLFIAQGDADVLVVPATHDMFVTQLCDAGQIYDSPLIGDLMTWTLAGFPGEPVTAECPPSAD